jgi:hypothetical protein
MTNENQSTHPKDLTEAEINEAEVEEKEIEAEGEVKAEDAGDTF